MGAAGLGTGGAVREAGLSYQYLALLSGSFTCRRRLASLAFNIKRTMKAAHEHTEIGSMLRHATMEGEAYFVMEH